MVPGSILVETAPGSTLVQTAPGCIHFVQKVGQFLRSPCNSLVMDIHWWSPPFLGVHSPHKNCYLRNAIKADSNIDPAKWKQVKISEENK